MEFVFEDGDVFPAEVDAPGLLGVGDGTEAAHGGLEDEDFGFGLAEEGHAEEGAAVPAFAAFAHQEDDLFVGGGSVEAVEVADVVVGGEFFVAHVDEDGVGRGCAGMARQRRFDGGAQFVLEFVNGGSEEGEFGAHAFVARVERVMGEEVVQDEVDEFIGARVFVAVDARLLEVVFVNGVLEAEGVDDFGEDLVSDVGGAGVVVASDHFGAFAAEAGGEFVNGGAQAGFGGGANAHVTFEGGAEGVVRFVHVDAELFEAAQFFEALVGDEVAFVFESLCVEIGEFFVDAAGGVDGFVAAEEFVGERFLAVAALEDDLLGVGDDEVEAGVVNGAEGGAGFFEEVEFEVGGEEGFVLRWDDPALVESHDLAQRLEDGGVGGKDEGVVAIGGIARKFVGEDELVEDAGGHQDGLAGAHRQSKDVVGIGALAGLHPPEDGVVGLAVDILEEGELAAPREASGHVAPFLEDVVDGGVVQVFFEEDVHFQRLELGLAQEGVGVVRIVEVQEALGDVAVVLADAAFGGFVEVVEVGEEGEVEGYVLGFSRHKWLLWSLAKAQRTQKFSSFAPLAPLRKSFFSIPVSD